jgi:hypothetical protein
MTLTPEQIEATIRAKTHAAIPIRAIWSSVGHELDTNSTRALTVITLDLSDRPDLLHALHAQKTAYLTAWSEIWTEWSIWSLPSQRPVLFLDLRNVNPSYELTLQFDPTHVDTLTHLTQIDEQRRVVLEWFSGVLRYALFVQLAGESLRSLLQRYLDAQNRIV